MILSFEAFLNENEENSSLEKEISSLVKTIKQGKTVFKDAVLDTGDRKWIITGISPDRTHEDLKVFYKNQEGESEKKVDFFDFHSTVLKQLLTLIKNNLEKS